jgi:RNA polymerase sigma-70 factor (ECF subfamily)
MSSFPDQSSTGAGPERVAARVEQLYASHSALVRSVCRSVLRDGVEAEDAVQRTFLSAQRALVNGSSPRDPAAWLATIARHESLARVRARMREPLPIETAGDAAGPDAHAAAVRREEVGELRDALAELPVQQREALLLREVRGFSYEEVASSLSVTTSTVESLLFRARRTLQARLRDSLAAFSPLGLVRELAGRLGGGYVAPAAAKALAVGAGAAIVTGGAIVGPRVIGLGHAPAIPPTAAARGAHRAPPAELGPGAARRAATPVRFQGTAGVRDALARTEAGRDSSGRDVASTESASSDGGDSASPSDGTDSRSPDGAETSGGDATAPGGENTATESNSQTTTQSTTETTTTSSGSSDSGGSGDASGSDGSGGTTTTGSPDGG